MSGASAADHLALSWRRDIGTLYAVMRLTFFHKRKKKHPPEENKKPLEFCCQCCALLNGRQLGNAIIHLGRYFSRTVFLAALMAGYSLRSPASHTARLSRLSLSRCGLSRLLSKPASVRIRPTADRDSHCVHPSAR